jgi:hypothetical protein
MNWPGHFLPLAGEFEWLLIGILVGCFMCEILIHDPKSRNAILRLFLGILCFSALVAFVFWRQ